MYRPLVYLCQRVQFVAAAVVLNVIVKYMISLLRDTTISSVSYLFFSWMKNGILTAHPIV